MLKLLRLQTLDILADSSPYYCHISAVRSASLLWGESLEGSAFNIIAYSPTFGMQVTLDEQVE
jgi:hypothetical protein